MKVSIGTNIKDGPWGGGNLFAINLKNYLESNKHKVVNNLDEDDIDLLMEESIKCLDVRLPDPFNPKKFNEDEIE